MSPATNLPIPRTPLIGRETETAEVHAWLLRRDVALLTLTGPGGIGKTRLALAAAREARGEFADGVFFAALDTVRSPVVVDCAILQALGASELPACSVFESLQHYLRDKAMLIVLDNFEHLMDAAGLVSELLGTCPRLKLMVTSRELLRVRGEHVYSLPPLAVPAGPAELSIERLAECAAVRLFIERARAVAPRFELTSQNAPAVASLCRQLEGVPLAIELAAARVNVLSPQMLVDRLGDQLALLAGGVRDLPARQRSLRATLDWSYALLPPDEQRLFRRLGVFRGGCTLEAAEAIGAAGSPAGLGEPRPAHSILEGLAALVDKSLVQAVESPSGARRYSLLEALREYALARLAEAGETEAIHQRHAAFYVSLAE